MWEPNPDQLFFYYFLTFELALVGVFVLQMIQIHLLFKIYEKIKK